MKKSFCPSAIFMAVCLVISITGFAQTTGNKSYLAVKNGNGYFPLSVNGKPAPLLISDKEYPGVVVAVKNFQSDINKVTGSIPVLQTGGIFKGKNVVIIGTLGKNQLLDQIIKNKKINVGSIEGKWEAHITQVVKNPLPGVSSALLIIGSDKRGTIYGIYDLSAQIGVSPWYWWADVPVNQKKNLFILPGTYTDGEPAVKYRGIFINDEAPAFSGWAKEKFGGAKHEVYTKIFDLILRLKGNYLWPAMWDNAFNDDDKLDPVMADEYGVVMGTSHHEPMDRAQQEWKRYGSGAWNYDTNGAVLHDFWKKGIENMGSKETIVTIGMRGDGDMPMTEGGNISLLEKIVKDQRKIIADVTGKDASETPQMWALYKEVQEYYDKGMRVPDDVTLLLCDDNWGNIRKLPKLNEPARKGGYGIYYHFDYVGDPRNYKWLNTNQISKTWEQMHLAYSYGAKQVWIVNVGDIKPMEFPISFFLDYAWSPGRWDADNLDKYASLWAAQQFGKKYAVDIAHILTAYTKYNSRRKPELLDQNTYSLVNYGEFENVVNDYNKLLGKAKLLYNKMPVQYKDAFYQLVLHPVEACANLNEMYYYAAKNKLYAAQGRSATNLMAAKVKSLYQNDSLISRYYNKVLANGKWDHMMDQTHIGYTYWQQPPANKMPEVINIPLPSSPQMGVSIQGSESWWPQEKSRAILPGLYPGNDERYIDIFNRGQGKFNFKITTSSPYLIVTPNTGAVTTEQRVQVKVNWEKLPKGVHHAVITIEGTNGGNITVNAEINNAIAQASKGFIENNGYISIEAAHWSKAIADNSIKWREIPDYGRTLSGVTAMPVTAILQVPGKNSPHLEYKVNLADTGLINVATYISPSLDFKNAGGLNYAVSFDDSTPRIVNINADKSQAAWQKGVADNIRILTAQFYIKKPGLHVLKYWMVDPGVVLLKLVISKGDVKASYLGPPESLLNK